MSRNPDPFSQLLRSGRIATYTLIAALGICYVLSWLTRSPVFVDGMVFDGHWSRPWSLLTYPFASLGIGSSLVWELLLLLWLYWIGVDLERMIGAGRIFAIFFISSAVGAASVYIAWVLTRTYNGPLMSSLIPIGALTVAWGTRNPNTTIRLWAIIPLTGKWLAIIDTFIVLFAVGDGNPAAGLFALIPLGVAWAYAADKLPGVLFVGEPRRVSRAAKATERREQAYFDDVQRRAKDREERERLRKLFEGSLDDDK